jgi:hypothetical protein
MMVMPLPIVTPISLLQFSKAIFPMQVTLLGIVTLVRLVLKKVLSPMLVKVVTAHGVWQK